MALKVPLELWFVYMDLKTKFYFMTNLNRMQNTNLVPKKTCSDLSFIYFLFPENVSTVQVNRARGRVK